MATRGEVVPVLRSHGLSGHVAARLWAISRTLLRDTRRRTREYSVLLDAVTGNQVGPTLSGSDHEIDVTLQIRATVPGRTYAHVHTHPRNSSFSDQDAIFFLSWSQVITIAVAGLDGRWYVMSRGTETRAVTPIDVADAFRAELVELLNNPDIDRSERPHVIWTRIAEQAGLRYDRIGSLEKMRRRRRLLTSAEAVESAKQGKLDDLILHLSDDELREALADYRRADPEAGGSSGRTVNGPEAGERRIGGGSAR